MLYSLCITWLRFPVQKSSSCTTAFIRSRMILFTCFKPRIAVDTITDPVLSDLTIKSMDPEIYRAERALYQAKGVNQV